MPEIYCKNCSKTSYSFYGSSCYNCGSYEVFPSSICQPVPKLDKTSTENYIPAVDALTKNVKEGNMLFEQVRIPIKIKVENNNITRKCATKRALVESLDKSNYNPPFTHSDIQDSNIKISVPADNFNAASRPSGFARNKTVLNICDENSQPKKSSEKESLVSKKKQIIYLCKCCNTDISNHAQNMNENYKCCLCPYETSLQRNLQRHSYSHQPRKSCSICEKEYVGDSHNDKRTCVKCKRVFICRTQLKEHNLGHQQDLKHHCRVCCDLIGMHCTVSDEKALYLCCVCEYEDINEARFKRHNNTHLPKLLCSICKEEYEPKEETLHFGETTCFGCDEKFQCKVKLEDHLAIPNNNCLSTHCIVCKEKIEKHRPTPEELYKCCQCIDFVTDKKFKLMRHLFTHSSLRPYKCNDCGKRYNQKCNLDRHSRKCSKFPFKCEICGVPFTSINSVDMHRLESHF